MKNKNYLIFIFVFLILNISLNQNSYSLENKIIIKIENEIITTLDIESEINYLLALNPTFKSLKKERRKIIATNSLVKEKIKTIEILKYIEKINLDKNFLQKLIQDRYSRLNLKNKKEFINYLKNYDININTIEYDNKISLWMRKNLLLKVDSNISLSATNPNKLFTT